MYVYIYIICIYIYKNIYITYHLLKEPETDVDNGVNDGNQLRDQKVVGDLQLRDQKVTA